MLQGTFEEYIVGRLVEKLQLASHAIGDIEALLEASGIDDDSDDGAGGFEEQIRSLVIAALAGLDVKEATRRAEESIAEAKKFWSVTKILLSHYSATLAATGMSVPERLNCRVLPELWTIQNLLWPH